MMWPPSMLRVRIRSRKRRFGLLLPLFLFWPPVLLIALALFPVVLLVALLLWPLGRGRTLRMAGPLFFGLFCALRGLMINVEGSDGQFYIGFR